MKNNLGALNEYLFTQLDALSNADLKGEELKEEIKRSNSIALISQSIIANANVILRAKKTSCDYGEDMPKILEG